MKLRVKENPHDARERTRRLMRTISRAADEAPLAEMAELIAFAKEDEDVAAMLVDATEQILAGDRPSLAPCWLVLVMGELELADGAWPLIFGLTASEGDALDEALVPVLTRHAVELFQDIVDAVDGAGVEDVFYRGSLYNVLEGVVVAGDEEQKRRLAGIALGWIEKERGYPREFCAVYGPLFLLAALGHPDARRLTEECRALCERGDFLDRELEDVRCVVEGEDLLDSPRAILATDWQDTARHIEGLFASTVDA